MVILNVILGVFVQFLSNPTILIALIVLIGLLTQGSGNDWYSSGK